MAAAALLNQLRQLRSDLVELIQHDPDQEVTGQAVPVIDAVISEARAALPDGSTLGSTTVDIISAETIEAGEPLRAADALVIVGQLLAVLHDGAADDEELREVDRRLFEEFRTYLPSSSRVVSFLRNHDFGAPFQWETLEPLDEFLRVWGDAEHRFFDSELDGELIGLHTAAASFRSRLAMTSFSDGAGWSAVVPGSHRDHFRLGGYEKDVQRVEELLELATAVIEQHQRFLELGRRRLAV